MSQCAGCAAPELLRLVKDLLAEIREDAWQHSRAMDAADALIARIEGADSHDQGDSDAEGK